MNKSESISKLATALCAVQAELQPASKDATNPYFKSKYATLSQVWDAVREPLTKHNLCVTQTLDFGDGNGVVVETTLIHVSGEFISGRLFMPCTKFDAQGVGSAISYARRYALAAIVGLSYYDDDAEGAINREARKEERKELKKEWVGSQKKIDGKVKDTEFFQPEPEEEQELPLGETKPSPYQDYAKEEIELHKLKDYLKRLGHSTKGIKDVGEAHILVDAGLKSKRRWIVWDKCKLLIEDCQLNDLVVADLMDALKIETDEEGKPKGLGLLELHKTLEGMKNGQCKYTNGKIVWEIPQ